MQDELMTVNGVEFTPTSPSLARARTLVVLIIMGIVFLTVVPSAIHFQSFAWLGTVAAALITIWLLWLVPRQARAISYAMTDDDFVIRRGIMFRSLVLVPYGRIQYVKVEEGPLARHYGFGTLEIHTASHATSATLPGVPMEEATRIRDILSQQGGIDRSGL